MLRGVDIAQTTGAPLTALVRTVPLSVGAHGLDLWFKPTVGKAIVSALRIERDVR